MALRVWISRMRNCLRVGGKSVKILRDGQGCLGRARWVIRDESGDGDPEPQGVVVQVPDTNETTEIS